MSLLLVVIEAFLAIMIPGVLLSFALLKKTSLPTFEIVVIGFIFGLIFPPAAVWLESYLIPYIHAFSFSAALYNANVIMLTIIGFALCLQQRVFTLNDISNYIFGAKPHREEARIEEFGERIAKLRKEIRSYNIDLHIVNEHEREEKELAARHSEEMSMLKSVSPEERARISAMHAEEERKLIEEHEKEEKSLLESTAKQKKSGNSTMWTILLLLMLFSFGTRMLSIGIAPRFFEFDPYFDMISTEYILTYGYQLLYDHSAWPTVATGTVHRIQPIVPYLEAYWYDLASAGPHSALSTTLLSDVSSFYPPITAALLVFVVFMFIYHEYGRFPALVGAALATAMPVLITTFIAGEQLLEPWGIFSMFFFYAAYLLAVNNPKDNRFAILAGIAFASTFLGAHYYTVNAGVFAIYIIFQGIIHVFRREETRDFYKMNAIVIAVSAVFYVLYAPYGATLTERIPSMFHIPIIIGLPLFSLLFIFIFEKLPHLLKSRKMIKEVNFSTYAEFLILLLVIVGVLAAFTSFGEPLRVYISLSEHFTTPSIPLFMTVQEYAPTGANFNFGAAGLGPIANSVGGIAIIVWAVMIVFFILMIAAIFYRNSKVSILAIAMAIPLAVAAMSEVKYLPHFGVAYIIMLAFIIGELAIYVRNGYSFGKKREMQESSTKRALQAILVFGILLVILEWLVFVNVFSAIGQNCNTIATNFNSIGYDMYCNVVPNAWLNAMAWVKANVGPYAPRVLSWWDYGDWINWFGNSNAVLRGDNAVATLDYKTAAIYVLGSADGYNASVLAHYMNSIQTKYVIFDNELQQKWSALDFLGCVAVNETSKAAAVAAGKQYGQPYMLGTSQCELSHDPVYALLPASINNVNAYCQFSNSSFTAVKVLLLAGNTFLNETYCVSSQIYTSTAPEPLYTANGTKINAIIIPNGQFYYGQLSVSGQNFIDFMVLYTPNGPNDSITDAPTEFYQSTYYKGFFFGKLPDFTLVYPTNFTGMNYVNTTAAVMIYALDNYTGGLPPVTPKPPWVNNNYTMPG
ncbi:MAG: hypothetical protein ACP5K9_02955 [Candidatus Micrarchaeia archaeon]